MTAVPDPDGIAFAVFCALPVAFAVAFVRSLRRRARRTAAALALLGFVSLGFVVMEGYYRFVFDETDSYNHTFTSQRWFTRHFRDNNAGVRDNVNYPAEIPAGKRRVTFVGDSFTTGHGVKNVDDRFANRLRQRHPEWDVEVMAGNGMDTGAELEWLETFPQIPYRMDLVVLVYCLNDISDLLPAWQTQLEQLQKESTQRNWLRQNSYFADAYYYRLRGLLDPSLKDYFGQMRDAYRGPSWTAQQERLKKLRAAVAAGGGRLVVVTFPFLHALGPDYAYAPVHEQLNAFWRAQGVAHLDLLPAYAGRRPAEVVVNRLDAHPNEFAHGLAAEAMDTFLTAELKRRE